MYIKKKVLSILIILISITTILSSCNKTKIDSDEAENTSPDEVSMEKTDDEEIIPITYPIDITDHANRTITIESKVEKIVSCYYIPSYTLIAMGLQEKVVGIENKPESRPFYEKFAPEMGKKTQVGTRKEVNIEEIVSLEPDLVILPDSLVDSAKQLEELGIKSIIVNPENIEKYLEMIIMIAQATDTYDRAEELIEFYSTKMSELGKYTTQILDTDAKTALVTSSSSPLRVASKDMFQVEILNNTKINNITDDIEGNHWADASLEQIVAYNPEYIFISSMPEFDISEILENKQWSEIDAVKKGNVFIIPSNIDNWETPSMASVCASYWMMSKVYPDVVKNEKVEEIAKEYYSLFFNYQISAEEMGL